MWLWGDVELRLCNMKDVKAQMRCGDVREIGQPGAEQK